MYKAVVYRRIAQASAYGETVVSRPPCSYQRAYSTGAKRLRLAPTASTVVTAVIACAATLAATQLWPSSHPKLAADAVLVTHKARSRAPQYATQEEVQKVIRLLREQLGEDKVTTNPDELLGHGSSPNTYHGRLDMIP